MSEVTKELTPAEMANFLISRVIGEEIEAERVLKKASVEANANAAAARQFDANKPYFAANPYGRNQAFLLLQVQIAAQKFHECQQIRNFVVENFAQHINN